MTPPAHLNDHVPPHPRSGEAKGEVMEHEDCSRTHTAETVCRECYLLADGDALRAQLTTLDTIARRLLPIHDTVRADAVTAGEEDCRAEWMLGWLSGRLVEARDQLEGQGDWCDECRRPQWVIGNGEHICATNYELRAQLADAQRVPDDEELDALEEKCVEVANNWTLDSGSVRNQLEIAGEAITTLRRRVAELEADRDRLRAGKSCWCNCGECATPENVEALEEERARLNWLVEDAATACSPDGEVQRLIQFAWVGEFTAAIDDARAKETT